MKKILLLLLMGFSFTEALTQNYETIRITALLGQFQKAKEDFDKAMGNPKFSSKAEAYMLKTFIYGSLAMDSKMKGTPDMLKLLADADAAFKKYKELDPSGAMITDQIYQSGPVNLYSGYYSAGYDDYAAKKWNDGADKLKKAVEYSDLLIEKKLLKISLDTNVLILAGITSENAGKINDAVVYYSRLADNKLKGAGFESVYRFLVGYYFGKKNFSQFEKYKAIGASLYPQSEFFTFDMVDFAVGLETVFNKKMKAVEDILTTDPNNFKANQVLGEIIYDELNPKDEKTPLPSNADVLEKKMIIAFKKAAAAKPGYEIPYIYLGDHFINKAVKVNAEKEAQTDAKAKEALQKKYGVTLELSKEPYEKAVEIFKTKSSLVQRDKQQYKKCVSYLADIAAYKKIQAKNAKSPDAAKYEAEEKKWNDLLESIK